MLRFIMGLCGLVFAFGLFGLALGALNELFDFGIWNNDYPIVDWDGGEGGSSATVPGTFGEYFRQTGLITLGAGALGAVLYWWLEER